MAKTERVSVLADDKKRLEIEGIARDWAEFMGITTPFEIQVGDLSSIEGITSEAHRIIAEQGHAHGVTIGAPDNSRFIVGIDAACPADKLEQVIVHELVHVHTFAQSGNDANDAMEVATELAAGLTRQLREADAALERVKAVWRYSIDSPADADVGELNISDAPDGHWVIYADILAAIKGGKP